MIRLDDDKVMKWYWILQDFLESKMSQLQFCKSRNVEYKKFCNMRVRILSRSLSSPEYYKKTVVIARQYLDSGQTPREFSKKNGISLEHLKEFALHLNYLDLIERKLKESPKEELVFHRVPASPSFSPPVVQTIEPEIMEARNDIELVIKKGVKVIVSADLGSDKLIKIIELLKDL